MIHQLMKYNTIFQIGVIKETTTPYINAPSSLFSIIITMLFANCSLLIALVLKIV